MDPFNFADALLGILAQRLAKRLCGKCKQAQVASDEDIRLLMDEYALELQNTEAWKKDRRASARSWSRNAAELRNDKASSHFTRRKAARSAATRYKGRVGLHELLMGTDIIKKNIQEHARVAQMLATRSRGMRTLKQDGIEKSDGNHRYQAGARVCIK